MELIMNTSLNIAGARVFLAAAVLAFSSSVFAVDLKVTLTGAEEAPPVTTSASGTGTISIAADKSVSGTIKTKGVDGTVGHIHVGAPGESGPPIITLSKG